MSDGLQIQQLLGSSDTSMPVNSKQPVILRTASFEDIERQGKGLLLALFKRLRRHGGVAGLALTPRQNLSRPQNDFLGDVATLPNFDIIGDFMSCEEDYRQGDEWRIAPVSFSKKEATCDGSGALALYRMRNKACSVRCLEDIVIESMDRHLHLTLHGWGEPALVLAMIPASFPTSSSDHASPDGASTGHSTPVEGVMSCLLCEKHFDTAEAARSACLFHPGERICERVCEGDGSDSGSSESSYDNEDNDEWYSYTCCDRRGDLSGCSVETQHILASRTDLVSLSSRREWRRSWRKKSC